MPVYYHATNESAARGILNYGFHPGRGGFDGPGIYLSDSQEGARIRSRHGTDVVLAVTLRNEPERVPGRGNYVVHSPSSVGRVWRT